MDFELTDEQKIWRQTIKDFAEKELTPLIDKAEEEEKFPVEILKKMASLGYLGVSFPPKYGGSAPEDKFSRKVNELIWMEEMSAVCSGIAFGIQAATVGAPNYVMRDAASEEQCQKHLVPSLKGEKIAAFALTEPEAGSDAAGIRTTADRRDNY